MSEDTLGRKQLILGFDTGCGTCRRIAQRVEEEVGGRLDVKSLSDPEIQHWRQQKLGDKAPWAPTLIEINGTRTKAWTGPSMGLALSRRLGPVATWRVMQVLGELHANTARSSSFALAGSGGMSRGRFLTGLGGAVMGISILSNVGKLAPSAAAGQKGAFGQSVGHTEIKGEELARLTRAMGHRQDISNITGKPLSAALRTTNTLTEIEHGEERLTAINGGDEDIVVKAARHQLQNGSSMLAFACRLLKTDQVMVYYEFDEAVPYGDGEIKTYASFYRRSGENLKLESLSANGKSAVLKDSARALQVDCFGCNGGFNDYFVQNPCSDVRVGCALALCAPCIPACATIAGCATCLLISCPYVLQEICCNEHGTTCFYCRR